MQHSACGGTSEAAFSPSGIVAGRWKTHRLSWLSTARPPTCPVTHLFGNACDQSGSGSNAGTCGRFVCPLASWAGCCTKARTSTAYILGFISFLLRFGRDHKLKCPAAEVQWESMMKRSLIFICAAAFTLGAALLAEQRGPQLPEPQPAHPNPSRTVPKPEGAMPKV